MDIYLLYYTISLKTCHFCRYQLLECLSNSSFSLQARNLTIQRNQATSQQSSLLARNRSSDEQPSFYCIQARCNPSQSTQAEDVKVLHLVLDIVTGDPCSAYCTCTVGFTQACGHIGAVLCLLAKWQAHGVQTAPGEAACTDKLCPWIDPKPATVKPKRFQDIGNHDLTNKRRRIADDYGSIVTYGFKPLTAEQDRDFREALIQATSHLGWVCPAVYALDPSRFPSIVQPGSALSSLPPTASLLSPDLAYSFEVTVTSQPLPIASLPHKTFTDATHPSFLSEVDAYISSFPYSTSDLQLIPLLTLGQSNNLEWFRQKYGSLTSSNFGRIVRYMMTRKADPDVLVQDVMGYRLGANPHQRSTSAPSLKYGIRYESVARNAHVSRRKLQHRSLEVKETGLHVHPDYPHLRASPDGIVSCGCHTTTILEIKCPFSSRDISVREAVRTKKLTYLELLPDFSLKLKQDTDYYHQVQGAMAVVGVNKCDFVVYTKKSMEILRVQCDPILWERTLKDLNTFFEVYVVPEIMTARIKEVLNPPKTTCVICHKVLPESDDIAVNNSNAAVACDCSCACATADSWYCWPCVGYTAAMDDAAGDWFCGSCRNSCS